MEKDALNRNDFMSGTEVKTHWPKYQNIETSPFEEIIFPDIVQALSVPKGKDEIVDIQILKPDNYQGAYLAGKISQRVLNLYFKEI